MSPQTLHERIREARTRLGTAGIADADAAFDAELLARHVLGWTKEQMLARWLGSAPAEFDTTYRALVDRRVSREPMAYILGRREFWGLELEVTRDVLIPRPETELIIEEALGLSTSLKRTVNGKLSTGLGATPTIVDVGTGSGCLAIALATELTRAKVIAIDVSTTALHVAKRNAERHEVAGRITWHAGSLLEPIDRAVDLIVSNPPYVALRDAPGLPPEVREYEPGVALFSGEDGLATIRTLVGQAVDRVRAGGWLIFEFGFGQADAVTAIIQESQAWQVIRLRADLQGIPRTAVLQRL